MNDSSPAIAMKERVIRPSRRLVNIGFDELWAYRELFVFFAWRDVVVRYKQTAIGIAWAVFRPLLTMMVFTVVFGKIAKLPSEGSPYPLFTLAALLPWQFFANSITQGSNSLIQNAGLISKIYFPRLIMPPAAVLANTVDFLVSLVILAAMMVWYRAVPTVAILWLPMFFMLAFFSGLAFVLWFSAINVRYRDVQYVIPFLVTLGMYVSPVGFGSGIVPEKWRLLYSLNPMVGVIDGFRWALLGEQTTLHTDGLMMSCGIVLALLVSGALYFRKVERTFADVI